MIVNWKGSGTKQAWHILKSHPICIKGLWKIMKTCQDRQPSGQNLNPGLPKYKTGVLTHITVTFSATKNLRRYE
jgi:hypothetical protein